MKDEYLLKCSSFCFLSTLTLEEVGLMAFFQTIHRNPYFLICLWSIPLLFVGLTADQSLLAHDEGLYATRAKIMFETGDWINPWENPHHKTPGIYWLIAISYFLFGVNEIAVRLPSLIFSLGCTFLLYRIAKTLFNQRIGLLASLILNLEFLWIRYSYLGNPDHITIFLFLLSIWCLLEHEKLAIDKKRNKSKYLLTFGFCLSLMIFFRGFLALMLIFSLLPYLLSSYRKYKYFKNVFLYLGLMFGAVPFAVWFYLSFQRYGFESVDALFGLFVDLSQETRRDNGYFYYVINTLGLCFPWIFFAGLGCYSQLKHKDNHNILILGIPACLLGMITLYETRLSHYALSLYPFLAILAALGIDFLLYQTQMIKTRELLLKIFSFLLSLIGILCLVLNVLVLFLPNISWFQSETFDYAYVVIPMGIGWSLLGFYAYKKSFQKQWLSGLLCGTWLTFLLLNSSSLITDINSDFKASISQPVVQSVVNNHAVTILGGGKRSILFKFYSPRLNYNSQSLKDLKSGDYAWVEQQFLGKKDIDYVVVSLYKDWSLIQRQ